MSTRLLGEKGLESTSPGRALWLSRSLCLYLPVRLSRLPVHLLGLLEGPGQAWFSMVPPSSQDEALSRYSASGEVPR